MFRCLISDVFSIKIISIFLDGAVDTPGHGKDVVGGFNTVQKLYLATFLIVHSTPEKDKIDSKRMHVDSMTKKGEVIFFNECKHLLDLCDEIGTNGDKKYAEREAKARLKHKYYWVNKE